MITAVGIAVVDHIMRIDGFRIGEGSFHVNSYHTEGGGMAATALCAAAKLGSKTKLLTRIGNDVNGRFILDELCAAEVDVSDVTVLPGQSSTVSWVLVDEATGEKQFYSERLKSVFTDHIDLPAGVLDDTCVLLLDGHWIEGSVTAGRWAKKNGIPVVADFKRFYDNLEQLFPYIDYFIIPAFFGMELTGADKPIEILTKLTGIQPGIPVITCGAEGGMYLEHGKVGIYPSFTVPVVDSTGAGDAFHGAFCHFLAQHRSFSDCLTLASAVGALNCRSIGGRRGLPTCAELDRFLKEHDIAISPFTASGTSA